MTAESTPPEMPAEHALVADALADRRSTASSRKDAIVQSPAGAAGLDRGSCAGSPSRATVCETSGWNWMP